MPTLLVALAFHSLGLLDSYETVTGTQLGSATPKRLCRRDLYQDLGTDKLERSSEVSWDETGADGFYKRAACYFKCRSPEIFTQPSDFYKFRYASWEIAEP